MLWGGEGESGTEDDTVASSSSEEEVISSSSDTDDDSELPCPQKQARREAHDVSLPTGMEEVHDVKSLHVGDFVAVSLRNEKRKRLFLSQVTSTKDGVIEVSFMKASGENTYIFPEVDDASVVDPTDIIGKVTQIKPDRRGLSWSVPFKLDKLT